MKRVRKYIEVDGVKMFIGFEDCTDKEDLVKQGSSFNIGDDVVIDEPSDFCRCSEDKDKTPNPTRRHIVVGRIMDVYEYFINVGIYDPYHPGKIAYTMSVDKANLMTGEVRLTQYLSYIGTNDNKVGFEPCVSC